jgi:predicted flap endonuclease-1-like 5' DNA nuclease
MHIVGAKWTPEITLLEICCTCGRTFWHRADRWSVRCPCGRTDHLQAVRERYNVARTEYVFRDPKITVSVEKTIKNETGPDTIETAQYQLELSDIPRNYMDEIKALIGDGQARVTVSADFGIKDYGTGASAMASVSLTCNQDTASVERAARLAGDMARDIAQEQRQRAENELQALLSQRQTTDPRRYG